MNIANLQIGYGLEVKELISLNIYLSGCKNNKGCDRGKCHNKELQSFDIGVPYYKVLPKIISMLDSSLIDCVVLLGGEPLDQDKAELTNLIDKIYSLTTKDIYIYTGYSTSNMPYSPRELPYIKGIFIGPYREGSSKELILYK